MQGQGHSKPLVLVLNPGSSSIKWSLHDIAVPRRGDAAKAVAAGSIAYDMPARRYSYTAAFLVEVLSAHNVRAAVVRVVHGGDKYFEPLRVDDDSYRQLQELVPLAPLHNQPAVDLIDRVRELQRDLPIVAVFDTCYFRHLPTVSQLYGLPALLVEKYGLRRYGFHGFAHESMVEHWEAANGGLKKYALVTAQLGSGCSMAAVRDGKPVDTTMGFTPNEGLLMRTRSGDIDPGLLTWLQRKEGWSPDDTDYVLHEESGWMGLSDGVFNMADLFTSERPQDQLAFSLFKHRFQKVLGSYLAILGGLNGIVLSGGIAENNAEICLSLLSGLSHLGIALEGDLTRSALPDRLSLQSSSVQCWVVAADEATSMLRSITQHHVLDDEYRPLAN